MKSLFSFFLFVFAALAATAQCGDSTHNASADNTWVSCQPSANPNAVRGSSHWIQYDFGYVYTLKTSHIWNANLSSDTDKGFREVVIDYSLDGQQWTELGTFELSEASGYQSYQGEPGPDFDGVEARYVILTALSNHGDPACYGLSEVRFDLDAVTATEMVEQRGPLALYPNPTTGPLRVEFGALRVTNLRLVDLQGRILQEFSGSVPDQLDVSSLPAGLYFVSVQDDEGAYHSGGFVKE